jgi:hypothetical protein
MLLTIAQQEEDEPTGVRAPIWIGQEYRENSQKSQVVATIDSLFESIVGFRKATNAHGYCGDRRLQAQ